MGKAADRNKAQASSRGFLAGAASGVLLVLIAPFAWADSGVGGFANQNVIDTAALSEARGSIAVNMAAGDFNLQANALGIAIGRNGGIGLTSIRIGQLAHGNQAPEPAASLVAVRDQAFANAVGVISLNQASGVQNLQANVVGITIGAGPLAASDALLAQTASPAEPPADGGNTTRGVRQILVGEEAFANARGIVQVNQSAGSRNLTSNALNLVLRLDGTR